MRALLDTCVLSELLRAQAHPGVREAVEAFDSDDLFVSVLSVGEIAKGIALLEESRKRRTLLAWLDTLQTSYGDRLLAVDRETSRIWGEITAAAQKAGRTIPASDG